MTERFDAVIVGGSLAGCTVATLLGRQGLRVAVVERRPELDAFKRVCTHNLQPCATPVLRRLGLEPALQAAGAVATHTELWTRYGWVRDPTPGVHGLNVRREILDPLVRRCALETPNVTWLGGTVARDLLRDDGQVCGVRVSRGAEAFDVRGRLVIGADGRNSRIGALAGVPARERPHNRFVYWAYWRGVPGWGSASRMWLLDPQCAYAFPNDSGLTLVAAFVHRDHLPAWKRDLDGSYRRLVDGLPDGPDLSKATREGRLLGRLDMPNARRTPVAGRVAFVGDAALAGDPLWGIGCGWALQSATWLADAVAPALRRGRGLRIALQRYRWTHKLGLADHFAITSDYSTGRPFSAPERALYRAAARDPAVAHALLTVGGRTDGAPALLRPTVLARVLTARLRSPG